MRVAALAFAALFLLGCAAMAPRPASVVAGLPVLAPATLGESRTAQQVLHVAFGGRDATLSAVLSITPERLQVVGLNAVGLRLFTVEYAGGELKSERSPGLPSEVDPARVLADLQLAFWPLAALQAATRDTAYEISEPYARARRLKRDGRLIAEVHYADDRPWNGRVWLSNFEHGYSLAVDSAP
jgi:hypothetical protein